MDYDNLRALADGRVSGRISEWPRLKSEARQALAALADLKAKLAEKEKACPSCGGTGVEYSGVCHCGIEMDSHSVYDNHSAVEMVRPCESCTQSLRAKLAAAEQRAERIAKLVEAALKHMRCPWAITCQRQGLEGDQLCDTCKLRAELAKVLNEGGEQK